MEAAKSTLRTILISGLHKPCSVRAAADAVGVSDSLVYQWCDPLSDKKPSCDQVKFLSSWLIAEYGDTRLAGLFLPHGWEVVQYDISKTNGSVDDEIADMVELAGAARSAFISGNMEDAEHYAHRLMSAAGMILEEIEAKK